MPKLPVIPNDVNKDAQTQFRQIASNAQDFELWTNQILTKLIVDYTEPQTGADESTASTTYVDLTNFSKSFTINNPLCLLSLNFALKGIGYIGVVINGLLVKEIPFQNAGFASVPHFNFYTLRNGGNTISIKWKASTGTITKANSLANPGLNSIQTTSFNS